MNDLDDMVKNLEELRDAIRHDLACMDEVDAALDKLIELHAHNAELIAAANSFDEELLTVLRERDTLREAGRDVITSLERFYRGFPGKLEWPEIHYLRHLVEPAEPDIDPTEHQ